MSTNLEIGVDLSTLTEDTKEQLRDTVVERLRIGGKYLRTDFAHNLTEATIEYGMETSYQLTLEVFDPDDELIKWKDLKEGLRAALKRSDIPGWDKFALVSVDSSHQHVSLVFEDEAVWRLRKAKGFDVVSRDRMTRAEFIYKMVRQVTHPTITFVSPQIFVKQPISTGEDTAKLRDERTADPLQGYGFSGDSVKVKGREANASQLNVLKTVLDLGVTLKVSKTVLVAAVATVTEESSATNLSGGDRDSVGAFQQRAGWGSYETRHNVKESADRFYQGKSGVSPGAVKLFRDNSDWTPWRLAFEVQHNYDTATKGQNSYGKWVNEARKTVDAYLGDDASGYRGSTSRIKKTKTAKYEFTRGDIEKGEKESTWDAARRLADEVGWRLFCYRGTVYYVADDDLRRRPHKTRLTRRRDGVQELNVSWDAADPISEITASVVADRYSFTPGNVILIQGLSKPITDTRWLVSNFQRSLFSNIGDLTLAAPVWPKPEPEPETITTSVDLDTGQVVGGGTQRKRAVEIAKQSLGRTGDFTYAMVRPIPASLSGRVRTDCSGFVTLCYKEAGAPDPNGNRYNGQGSTATLWSYGKPTSNPQPGDLAFYGNPSAAGGSAHVTIIIDDKDCIGFGSQGGPRRSAINYRPVVGYRTYPLDV
jgi:hypothetical protein